MPFTCVSLTYVHQKGLFCRVASEVIHCGVFLPWTLTTFTGANFFFFFHISASFDITLAPHSGNFIEHKETKKHPPYTKRGRTSRPGDGYTPIYQPMLQRASRPLSLCPSPAHGTRRRYQKAWGNSNKFMKLKLFAHFLLSLKALPSSSSPSSACVSYVLPSHLCHRFSGKCVYC